MANGWTSLGCKALGANPIKPDGLVCRLTEAG